MGNVRVQKGRQLLQWIMANPDRPLTVEEMATAVKWSPNSTATSAARHMSHYPQLTRTSKGVYMWSTKVDPNADAEPQPIKELLLKVIKHAADGRLLAEDVENPDHLYVVEPFEF